MTCVFSAGRVPGGGCAEPQAGPRALIQRRTPPPTPEPKGHPMLTVTDDAKSFLKELIDHNNLPEDTTIRLTATQEGLGLAPDTPSEQDTTFELEGRVVLTVADPIATQLADKSLSINQTEQGPTLAIA